MLKSLSGRFDRLWEMLGEPSTWAGIATVLLAVGQAFPELAPFATRAATIAGSIAVIAKEKSSP